MIFTRLSIILMECLDHWIACTPIGKIVRLHGRAPTKARKKNRQLSLKQSHSDYHLWFWHAAYGYAGTMNDISILALSPFLETLLDGSFATLEADVVPYNIGTESFKEMYVLVDGIYPLYSRFIRGFKEPVRQWETKFTAWQEASRKDIERAFGVLKGKCCPIAWQGSYKGKEKNRQLSLKQSLIITCGFGMLPMVMREQ
jgi:Plant transposon protein